MTLLVPDAKCPVCGHDLLITFRTVGPERKTFEYHHQRLTSSQCIVVIPQPDTAHYEDMVYIPLIAVPDEPRRDRC